MAGVAWALTLRLPSAPPCAAPNPLAHLLGSLMACTAYTADAILKAQEQFEIRRVQWEAKGW